MTRAYLDPFWSGAGLNVWADATPTQTIITSASPKPTVWIDWVGTNQTIGTYDVRRWPRYVWQTWQQTNASTQHVLGVGNLDWAVIDGAVPMLASEPSLETRRVQLMSRNRIRARQLRNKQAEHRAEQLLLECLSPAQRTEWLEGRHFHVQTADGQRCYRIAYGTAGNVRLVEVKAAPPVERGRNGGIARLGAKFCMHVYHPEGPVPAADNCLAQKLLIEADEATFIREANISYA